MAEENKAKSSAEIKHRSVLKTLIDLVFIAFCAGISMFYLYISNLTELRFREIVMPLLVFSAIGWILYLILRLTLKSSKKPAMLSGIVMSILTNAGMLTNALGYVVVLLISAVVIAAVFFLIIRLADAGIIEKLQFIVSGVMAALILFNVVISIPQLIENKRLSEAAADKAASLEKIEVPAEYAGGGVELPNLYIFVFDELAGTKCMQEVFGYDNTGFYDDMRQMRFTVSDDCTNSKQFTMECLSGLFNLDYVFDYDTEGYFACRERFQNAKFFSLMKEMGYSLYETEVAGFVNFEPRMPYGTSKEYSQTEDGYTTLDVIMDRTLFRPLADALGIFPLNYDLFDDIMTYYTLPESYSVKNAMTFSYICCPHAPFIYDLSGNPVDKDNSMNWIDSKYFLEQYEYMCGRIVDTMQGITQNDPDAIILVLSDHGVKPNKALWNGPNTTYEQSIDTFFAVYTGGRDDLGDITGLSGANVLRTVLNMEYGFDLNMTGAPEN